MRTRARFSPRRKALMAAVLLALAAMTALRLMGIAGFNGTQPREMDWNDDGVATGAEIVQGYTLIAIHETREGQRTCRHYARLRERQVPFRVECRVEFGKQDAEPGP
jgi:hypothetical protein